MNNEYLWQKTGDDPTVRELEKTLEVFRYKDMNPPVLPVATPRASFLRWRFPLGIATAAFATLLIVVGLWFQAGVSNDDSDITFVYYPETDKREQPIQSPAPEAQPAAPTKQPVRRVRPEIQSAAFAMHRRSTPKSVSRRKGTVVLSKQEQYAYDRLLLALSISSSKINIVRNTIDGVEENEDGSRKNNR